MLWAAILYAIVGTWLVNRIGRPLIGLNYQQQQYEADLRFSLVRLRENAEGIALYGGEKPSSTPSWRGSPTSSPTGGGSCGGRSF